MNVRKRRGRFDLTPSRMAHLNACSAQKMSLPAAAKEIGARVDTIKLAAKREGKESWLRERFPKSGRQGEQRKKGNQSDDGVLLIPKNPQTKWLTKAWRKVA